jgi:hypothetical protein
MRGADSGTIGHASAYSTGGGGVVLEHAYGGALLAELLLGGPVTGLGNDVTPVRIGFQQSAHSPVDDLMVVGDGPGGQRTLFIGVRRKPSIGVSQRPFVKLMVDYLRVVSEHRVELEAGSWRLGLAVVAPHTPTDEIKVLADFARLQPEAGLFRAAVHAPSATTGRVRTRLANFDEVVAAAVEVARDSGIVLAGEDAGDDLSWRLLRYLRILDLWLEGDDAAGKTSLVARLVPLAGDAVGADDLRRRLCELSAGYAVGSAVVTEEMLRRDLSGVIHVAASPAYQASWEILESLEHSLNSRTRRSLATRRSGETAGVDQFAVDRGGVRSSLVEAIGAAGREAGQLVVHGEPGAGKSAAVLTAVEEIRCAGGAVVALSLRDLPPSSALATAKFLQASPRAVLAATAAAPVRLVVLDGAEAAQEAGPELLHDLARAASQAGLGLVAVTRDDARETVTGTLSGAREAGAGDTPPAPAELEIPPLGDEEVSQVRQAFAGLDRLAADERSAWLLRRVGIIDVLLRGDAVASLRDGSLSEADVFAAVWHAWVRNREQPSPGGATPDGRDDAMIGLARRYLAGSATPGTPPSADPRALASLRSDGLLLSAGPRFAFRRGDEFSSDMVRDFALAVLFLREGFNALNQARGPRWALRAARMACQGMLIDSQPGSHVAARMRGLQREFDALAAEFGERWADVPWEAALTAGTAESVIRDCAHDLLQPGGVLLDRVLRLISQRFNDAGAADPAIAAPVVEFLIEHPAEVEAGRYRFAEEASKLTASWLRAVRRAEMAGGTIDRWRPLRARVRDCLLRPGRADYEVEAESLALLGADTSAQVTGFLRGLAARQPARLAPCVELFDPTMSLAATDLDLLFELTEAYYIEDASRGIGWPDMGIRRHKHTHGRFGVPFADWRFGPFWRLIPAAPDRALTLINRILDHAVTWRVSQDSQEPVHPWQAGSDAHHGSAVPGIQLDIPGIGARYFTGDQFVWAWYRGTGVGPHPCMSALMAVERFADQWLQQGTPLPGLVTALLRHGHNLAMPGLVAGLLARHAEQVASEADPFLASPEVWGIESARAAMEAGVHAGCDDPSVPGSDRRRWTMADLAGCLVINAINRGDQDRINALRATGTALIAAAARSAEHATGSEDTSSADNFETTSAEAEGERQFVVVVRRWASMLDADNYAVKRDNENVIWEWQPPADIEAAMAASRSDFERRRQAYRLIDAYSVRLSPPFLASPPALPPAETICADAQAARSLVDHPLGPESFEAAAAVAAALLRAAVRQASSISRNDLEWAAVTVAEALSTPLHAPGSSEGAWRVLGARRSAASAAACLLMPPLTGSGEHPGLLDDEDMAALPEILATATASPSADVRMITARTLGAVWAAPCGPGPHGSDRCRHAIAWTAVEAGTRHVALDPPEFPAGTRGRRQLDGPLAAALAVCPATDLMLNLLAPPLIAACDAAHSTSCIAPTAQGIRDSLLDAYTRTALHWAEKGYDHRDEDQYAVVEALLNAATQDPGLLTTFIAGIAGQARALSETLRAMRVAATYSATGRAALRSTWPAIMNAVLDAVDAGALGFSDHHWGEYVITEMIPSPSTTGWDPDPDATVSAARDGWPTPSELTSQIERLLPHAAGYWHAADNLIGLLKTIPVGDQARMGLPWIHQIMTSRSKQPGMGTWLTVEWLRSLSEMHAVNDEARPLYDALVDALAAEDYRGAVELQRQGE